MSEMTKLEPLRVKLNELGLLSVIRTPSYEDRMNGSQPSISFDVNGKSIIIFEKNSSYRFRVSDEEDVLGLGTWYNVEGIDDIFNKIKSVLTNTNKY